MVNVVIMRKALMGECYTKWLEEWDNKTLTVGRKPTVW